MIASLKKHIKWALSGRFGTISLPRVWMAGWGVLTAIGGGYVLHQLLTLHDPAALLAWRDILQVAGPWALSICSLPYAVSKGASTLSDVVSALRK